jgi:AraC-like DNA-binding protein
MLIETIGHETITDSAYDWDGRTRQTNGYLFQYTLAGSGWLEVEGQLFEVKKNQAFVVEIPGPHRYYYDPREGEPWEVIWVRLRGGQMASIWDSLNKRGPVLQLNADAEPIAEWRRLFHDTVKGKLNDPYVQSVRIYEWLLTFLRLSRQGNEASRRPDGLSPYSASIAYMREKYGRTISLEELAAVEHLSKSHYCKAFHRALGLSPFDYLNRVRVEEAAELLGSSVLTVTQIASATGFETTSYFGKVFKRYVGMTPLQYREGQHDWNVDRLKLV